MPNKLEDSSDSGKGIILGAILVGRTRELPVNYFFDAGVVMAGVWPLGKANNLEEALAIAKAKKRFRQSDRLRP